MWRTAIITFAGMALLACNGGQGGVPTAQPTTPLTPTAQPKIERNCQQLPVVSLRYEDQTRSGMRTSLNWSGLGCAASAHPSFNMPVPTEALVLPAGDSPVLMISETPFTADASVMKLPLEKATPVEGGLQIPLDDFDGIRAEQFDIDPVMEQVLTLPPLPPGDYLVRLGTTWQDGRMGFAFRIEIVEAVDE